MRRRRVTEVEQPTVADGPIEPPPWWREHWWWPLLLLLLFVALLIGFLVWRSEENEKNRVPDVVGMSEANARVTIREEGFTPLVERIEANAPLGEVYEQSPAAGDRHAEGADVTIRVSVRDEEEPATTTETTETVTTETTETVTRTETVETSGGGGGGSGSGATRPVEVIDVVGLGYRDAADQLEGDGLIVDSVAVASDEPAGTVLAQNPAGATQAQEGDHVRINIALGPNELPLKQIPDVTGVDEADARKRLREAGFTVKTLDRDASKADQVGVVLLQRPGPSSRRQFSQVTIYVGR